MSQRVGHRLLTLIKITVGYLQILGAFERFDKVRWPELFRKFYTSVDFTRYIHLELYH